MNISPLVLALLGELLLITTVISVFMLTGSRRRRKSDHAAALALIGQIKGKEESRQEETRALVDRVPGVSDTGVEELVLSIRNGELAHYQLLVDSYIKRDAKAFEGVCESFEAATEPYRKMAYAQESVSEDAEVEVVDPGELEILREEKERLAVELKITMDTMGRMLNEYACMYAGGAAEEFDTESIASLYNADDSDTGEGEEDVIEDTASSRGSGAVAATPPENSDIPALDQEWIEEAIEASESEETPGVDAGDQDRTAAMDVSRLRDDLVSLDVETGKGAG